MPETLREIPKRIAGQIGQFVGRAWILPKLLEWLDSTGERILVLTGGPGSGKSMVAAWLSGWGPEPVGQKEQEQLARIRSAVKAVYFCQARSRNVAPLAFAKSVAEQLVSTVRGAGDAFASTLAPYVKIEGTVHVGSVTGGISAGVAIERLDLAGLGDELSFDRSFSEPLKNLYATGYSEPILLVVDALDEALTYTGLTIPKILSGLDDLPAPIRILITTRHDPRVLKLYRSAPCIDLVHNCPEGVNDLREYIVGRLGHLVLDEPKRADFAERLWRSSDANFLYTDLVLDQLFKLSTVLLPDLDSFSLPAGLIGLYLDFVNRELGSNEQLWFTVYEPILGLIAVAQGDGLTSRQLGDIVGRDVRLGLRACKQYLSGDFPEGPFRLFHQSFSEFLLEDLNNLDFRVDPKAAHKMIASHYLSSFRTPRGEGGPPQDDYLYRYLPYHLESAGEHGALRDLLLDFLWMREKLKHTNIYALYSDYALSKSEHALDLLRRALALSESTLASDERQLAGQLLGRLAQGEEGLKDLLEVARRSINPPSFLPLLPTLIPPGEQIRRIDYAQSIQGLMILPDGDHVLSGGSSHISLWNLESGVETQRLDSEDRFDELGTFGVTSDGLYIISTHHSFRRSYFTVWGVETGMKINRFESDEGSVCALAVLPDNRRVLTLHPGFWGEGSTVKLWDMHDGRTIEKSKTSDYATSLALTHDGKQALVGFRSGILQLWQIDGTVELRRFNLTQSPIRALTWMPDNQRAVIHSGGLVWMLDVEAGTETCRYASTYSWGGQVGAMTVASQGRWILSADFDSYYVRIWDAATGKEMSRLGPHELAICALSASPDGRRAASGSLDATIRIWELSQTVGIQRAGNKVTEVRALAMMPDSSHVLTAHEDGTHGYFSIRDQQNLMELKRLDIPKGTIEQVAITPDARAVLALHNRSDLRLWSLDSGDEILTFTDNYPTIRSFAITPDGRRVISGHWIVPSMRFERHMHWHDDWGDNVARRHTEQHLNMKLWSLESGQELCRYLSNDKSVLALCITPDGKNVITNSGSTLRVWEIDSGKMLRSFTCPSNTYSDTLDIAPNGWVIAGCKALNASTLSIWDYRTGEEVGHFESHRAGIRAVRALRNGLYAISCAEDRSVRLWELATGAEKARFDFDAPPVFCDLAKDESHVLVKDYHGQLHVLELVW